MSQSTVTRDYVLLDCGCHSMVSIMAPARDGERHAVAFPRFDSKVDDVHYLVAKNGRWEIA